MLEDFNTCRDSISIQTGVCIVGAGAAGITLARQLMATGVDVCLLESGGNDYENTVQDMAAGHSVGYPYYPLADSRLRFFGGTTSIWGGRVAQLDRIDFDRRDWVTNSGWPFEKSAIAPYYARAQRQLDVAEIYGSDNMVAQLGYQSDPFDAQVLRPAFWQFDEHSERFTLRRCTDLVSAPNVKIMLHATVVHIQVNGAGTAIDEVAIANLHGGRAKISAKAYVLAAGGLENPRLLLSSSDIHHRGIGNTYDLVGRFFMEHPRARGAHVRSDNIAQLLDMFPRLQRHAGHRYAALLRGSEALQAREGLLNTSLSLSVRQHADDRPVLHKRVYRTLKERLPPNRLGRSLWLLVRQGSVRAREQFGPLLRWNSVNRNRNNVYVVVRAEQAPNPDSRVTLARETDALGTPRLALDWRFSEIDKRTVSTLMSVFDRELKRCNLGRLDVSPWLADGGPDWETDPLISNHPIGGYHHMGTTRMASSPRQGVVDTDCRVHGIGNLYVAGSSVFPTGGWANPTLTILALALKLSDKLQTIVDRSAMSTSPERTITPQTALEPETVSPVRPGEMAARSS